MNIPVLLKVHVSPHLMSNMSAVRAQLTDNMHKVEVRALCEKILRMCSESLEKVGPFGSVGQWIFAD